LSLPELDIEMALQAEQRGGVQNRRINVVEIHVGETSLGVPCCGTDLAVRDFKPEHLRNVVVAESGGTRNA
jgi:hypothetical protein